MKKFGDRNESNHEEEMRMRDGGRLRESEREMENRARCIRERNMAISVASETHNSSFFYK